ncbi:MAG: hypothetical protein RR848_07335 [Oscillospiraceae bacterium]
MRKPFDGISRVTQRWSTSHYGMNIVGDTDKTVHSVCVGIVRSSNMITNKKTPLGSGAITCVWMMQAADDFIIVTLQSALYLYPNEYPRAMHSA